MQVSGHSLKTLQRRGKNTYWYININFRPEAAKSGCGKAKKLTIHYDPDLIQSFIVLHTQRKLRLF